MDFAGDHLWQWLEWTNMHKNDENTCSQLQGISYIIYKSPIHPIGTVPNIIFHFTASGIVHQRWHKKRIIFSKYAYFIYHLQHTFYCICLPLGRKQQVSKRGEFAFNTARSAMAYIVTLDVVPIGQVETYFGLGIVIHVSTR